MYVPKIGDRVKLKRFDLYTAKGWNPWTWLIVRDIYLRLDPLNEPYAVGVSVAEDVWGNLYHPSRRNPATHRLAEAVRDGS